ncbi:MAG: efflux RND transporter periplasmic adaptor subunit, partial [Planctomycetota bacterium]
RGPFQFAPVAKVVAIIALIAGIGWFAGFHRVTEKVDADCFVAPFTTRIVTAEIDGEIGEVHFENGQIVEEGDVLIKFDTQDIDISLRRAQEEAEKIRAQISRLRGRAEDEENIDQRGQILAELRAKEHELNAEEEQINLLKDRLERATLRAPISGMMLEPEEPDEMRGVTASSGETLGRIGDVSEQVQVKVAIPGGRISEIETDYPVEIRLRPLVEERIVEGNIRHISSRSVTYEESNVFMAEVVVPRTVPAKDNSDRILTLQPGMTGKGKVLLPGETTYASIYARKLYRNVSYWLF